MIRRSTRLLRCPDAAGLLLVVVAVAGCAGGSGGKDFDRSALPEIELGETRREYVTQAIGDPWTTGYARRGRFPFLVYIWRYTTGGGARSKRLTVGFNERDEVAFYDYESNFEGDATDFDIRRAGVLEVGKTTTEQARSSLGPPSGRDFDIISEETGTLDVHDVWRYRIARTEGASPIVKQAVLRFDAGGVLRGIEIYAEGLIAE